MAIKILLSNDDGVYAKGLCTLVDALKPLAEALLVVAPDRNRSGASNSLTLDVPLHIHEIEPNRFCVEGTPTDCVHLALTGMSNFKPDIVISGINEGGNLGDDVLYSGTVAAATEGRFCGYPAIAVSLAIQHKNRDDQSYKVSAHYKTAAHVIKQLLDRLHHDPLPSDTILNVNVPNVAISDLKGYEVTRLGTRHQAEPTIKQKDPRGRPIYWIGPPGAEQDAGPGTDFHAISRQRVSITPLRVDATRYESFDQLAKWIEELKH